MQCNAEEEMRGKNVREMPSIAGWKIYHIYIKDSECKL